MFAHGGGLLAGGGGLAGGGRQDWKEGGRQVGVLLVEEVIACKGPAVAVDEFVGILGLSARTLSAHAFSALGLSSHTPTLSAHAPSVHALSSLSLSSRAPALSAHAPSVHDLSSHVLALSSYAQDHILSGHSDVLVYISHASTPFSLPFAFVVNFFLHLPFPRC